MPGVLIILLYSFANFRRGDPDDGVGVCVIVGWPAEDFHTENTFFELIGFAGQNANDNIPQKTRIPLAGMK
jgi:hypothetical protein